MKASAAAPSLLHRAAALGAGSISPTPASPGGWENTNREHIRHDVGYRIIDTVEPTAPDGQEVPGQTDEDVSAGESYEEI
jgi:hypothetical protein